MKHVRQVVVVAALALAHAGPARGAEAAAPKVVDVTAKSFRSLEKKGELAPTSADRTAEGWAENAALDEAVGALLVEQLGGKEALVRRYTAAPSIDGKTLRSTDGGNVVARLTTRDGRDASVVLLGSSFAARDLSETLSELGRKTTPEHNYAAVYGGISEVLAKDPKTLGVILRGMPEPGKIGRKDADKLLREIVKRWDTTRPGKLRRVVGKKDCSTTCEKDVSPRALVGGADARGCYGRSEDGLWATADWPLKGAATCVKDQGETRGTSAAFAIAAAVEAAVRREHEVCPDLSEQHLHYAQKNLWFPIPPNFGDDLNAPSSVLGMMVGDYEFRTEKQWAYNLSPKRREVAVRSKGGPIYGYEKSCEGYADEPCSDTNHQGQLVCAKGARKCGYTAQIPPAEEGFEVLAYNAFFDVQNATQTIDVAPLFLSLGLPVVASFQVTQSFLDAADDGWVRPAAVSKRSKGAKAGRVPPDALRGWHVAMLEGFVRNEDLPKGASPAAGGGYFVMKNSWGPCVGDGGYWYVPKQWMADHALSMTALTGIEAYGQADVVSLLFDTALPPETPDLLAPADDSAVFPGFSFLSWYDSNPSTTSYQICLRRAVSGGGPETECTWLPVPPHEAAMKRFHLQGSLVYGEPYRGERYYWSVAAGNAAGWSTAQANRRVRFVLPNPRLFSPMPGHTAVNRTPNLEWYAVDGAESYRITVGPSPMPAPNPPTDDGAFKHYDTPGLPAGTQNGKPILRFPVPSGDPIPATLGNTVHWYAEACKTIGGDLQCSRFPYWFNRPEQLEGVFYFGTMHLPGGQGVVGMTFEEACQIIRELVDSPRCRNCHQALEDVTRGNAMDAHQLNPGTACSTCHNESSSNAPWPGPGEPLWQAPGAPGMHWTGLQPAEIVGRIADPATNGGRTLAQIATHVVTDHLVLWGFDPVSGTGNTNGRTPAPHELTYAEAFQVWAAGWTANGSSCD